MKNNILLVAILAVSAFVSCKNGTDEVLAVRLEETQIELVKGSEKQLVAVAVPSVGNEEFEWFSSMPEYVSVSPSGVVKAEKIYYKNETDTEATPVSVFCRYKEGAAECKVTVLPLAVESMEIKVKNNDSDVLILEPGEKRDLELVFYPEDADVDYDQVVWSTTAFDFADVTSKSGKSTQVEAKWPGSVTIKAAYGRVTASVNLIVNFVNAESVTIAGPDKVTMKVGDAKTFTASFLPEDATVEVVWSSSDTQVAKVDPDTGVVNAVSEGTAKIKAVAGLVEDVVTVEVVAE